MSRLQANKHYMSDVVFGAALGLVSGRVDSVGQGAATLVITPLSSPGGGGIGLTLAGARSRH